MATDSILIIRAASARAVNVRPTLVARVRAVVADYWALTKPEINFLIALVTFAGVYLVYPDHAFPVWLMTNALLGTLLVSSGAAALNQCIERRFDAQMRRTARRPVAARRIKPSAALWFGVSLSAAGVAYLAVTTNVLASLLAASTLATYLFLYTPLKRRTSFCTMVGALPGAMPPLIGAAAAAGGLSSRAWLLCTILFLWQFPHFMAIAWMYREDYDRAGYIVLPQGQSRFRVVALQTILPLLGLIAIDLVPTLLGKLALLYQVGAVVLSLVFFYYGVEFVLRGSKPAARRLLVASLLYLPLLLLLMMIGKAQ